MRLQNDMKIARTNSMELSPQQIMNSLEEKTQVNHIHSFNIWIKRAKKKRKIWKQKIFLQVLQFMVEEKLPKEITAKKLELQAYEDVINERNVNNQYLNNLQNQVDKISFDWNQFENMLNVWLSLVDVSLPFAVQIDKISREIKEISESRFVERESDNLMPFRQQAATVIRIKETSAEQLDELTKSIREIESTIMRKQAELKERVGETYLRGDDLKQYVNMLKAKSSVYKKQRAELSALEVSFIHLLAFFKEFFLCIINAADKINQRKKNIRATPRKYLQLWFFKRFFSFFLLD